MIVYNFGGSWWLVCWVYLLLYWELFKWKGLVGREIQYPLTKVGEERPMGDD